MNQRTKVQIKAVAAAVKGFASADRGKVIMPCGTGKTRVGLKVRERLKARRTLVLCPALSLVKQNLDVYLKLAKIPFHPTVVCSDETTANEARIDYQIGVETTTDPAVIAKAFRSRGEQVFFATYQSAEMIAAAGVKFDLIVFDEAHRTAGTEGVFSIALHDKNIPAKKRLFLTATPRTMRAALKQRAAEDGIEVVCMDDEALYGKEVYRLEFAEAVELGLLTAYEVVIFGVKADQIANFTELKGEAATIAARFGLIKAMEKYKIRKVISYHASTKGASDLSNNFGDVFETMKAKRQASGTNWAKSLDGKTPVSERNDSLQEFAELPATTRAVLANCKVLTEGVDAPAVDAVAFMDPKSSVTDIVQAVGRCMRLCEGKNRSFVVVPVFMDGENEDKQFGRVLDVLHALRGHDGRIDAEIQLHRERKKGQAKERLFDRLPFIHFENVGEDLIGRIEPRILNSAKKMTEDSIVKYVREYVSKTNRSPSGRRGFWANAIGWVRRNLGLKWQAFLSKHGFPNRDKVWTDAEIKTLVLSYVELHGYPPAATHAPFSSIAWYLRKTRKMTFTDWLRKNGFEVRNYAHSEDLLHRKTRAFIDEHGRPPKCSDKGYWPAVNQWLNLYLNSNLADWLFENRYSSFQRVTWTDALIRHHVDLYLEKYGCLPTQRSEKPFPAIQTTLRKRGSSLCKWLLEQGYSAKTQNTKSP